MRAPTITAGESSQAKGGNEGNCRVCEPEPMSVRCCAGGRIAITTEFSLSLSLSLSPVCDLPTMPAQLTATSREPNAATVPSQAASTLSGDDTSHCVNLTTSSLKPCSHTRRAHRHTDTQMMSTCAAGRGSMHR